MTRWTAEEPSRQHAGVLAMLADPRHYKLTSLVLCGACGKDDGGCDYCRPPAPPRRGLRGLLRRRGN